MTGAEIRKWGEGVLPEAHPQETRARAFYWIGWAGFWAFAATLVLGPAIPQMALVLLLAFFVYWAGANWAVVRSSSLFWMSLAFSLYALGRALIGYWNAPGTFDMQYKGAEDLLQMGGVWSLLLVPWLLGARGQGRLNWMIGLALAGLFAELILAIDWDNLATFMRNRPNILVGANALGAVVGVAMIAMVTLGQKGISRFSEGKNPFVKALLWGLWLAGLVFLVWLLVFTQSRQNWLATLITLPVVTAVVGVSWYSKGSGRQRVEVLAASLALAVGLVATLVSQWGLIEKRLQEQREAIARAASVDHSRFLFELLKFRKGYYIFGTGQMLEAPLWGYSPGGVSGMMEEEAPGPRYGVPKVNHIHSEPLQMALEVGLVGVLLFYAMVGFSVKEVIQALRSRRISLEWAAFWMGGVAYLAIQGMFDVRSQTYLYGVLMMLLGAVAMACQFGRLSLLRSQGAGATS